MAVANHPAVAACFAGGGLAMPQTGLEDDLTPLADCSQCNYRDTLLSVGSCKPGDCCVVAESGRQIDRFFRVHPV
jgi:hypothetical protein